MTQLKNKHSLRTQDPVLNSLRFSIKISSRGFEPGRTMMISIQSLSEDA